VPTSAVEATAAVLTDRLSHRDSYYIVKNIIFTVFE
jgi:hypothetical protein